MKLNKVEEKQKDNVLNIRGGSLYLPVTNWYYEDKNKPLLSTLKSSVLDFEFTGSFEDKPNERVFIVGAPQGRLYQLLFALDRINEYPRAKNDKIVIMGDLIGPTDKNVQLLDFLQELEDSDAYKDNLIILRGKTDQDLIYGGEKFFNTETGKEFLKETQVYYFSDGLKLIDWLEKRSTYFATVDNLLISPGGIKPSKPLHKQLVADLLYSSVDFVNSLNEKSVAFDKTIVYTCDYSQTEDVNYDINSNTVSLNSIEETFIPVMLYNSGKKQAEELFKVYENKKDMKDDDE